jgi:hypothetical protein
MAGQMIRRRSSGGGWRVSFAPKSNHKLIDKTTTKCYYESTGLLTPKAPKNKKQKGKKP